MYITSATDYQPSEISSTESTNEAFETTSDFSIIVTDPGITNGLLYNFSESEQKIVTHDLNHTAYNIVHQYDLTLKTSQCENCTTDFNITETPNLLLVFKYQLICLLLFLNFIGTSMNLFLLYLLLKPGFYTLRTCMHFSLTFCNLLLLGISWILTTAMMKEEWPLEDVGCSLYSILSRLLGTLINSTLAAIAIERCVYTRDRGREIGKAPEMARKSQHIDTRYKKYSVIVLLITFIYSLLWPTPALLGFSHYKLENSTLVCLPSWTDKYWVNITYQVYFLLGSCFVPLVAIVICLFKFNTKVTFIEKKLQNNRRRSSVVRLAMMVSRAPRTSVTANMNTRRSISSVSSVVLRDTHLYIRESLNDDLRNEMAAYRGSGVLSLIAILMWLPLNTISMVTPDKRDVAMAFSLVAMATTLLCPVIIVSFNHLPRDALLSLYRQLCGTHQGRVSPTTPPNQMVATKPVTKHSMNEMKPQRTREGSFVGSYQGSGEGVALPPIEESNSWALPEKSPVQVETQVEDSPPVVHHPLRKGAKFSTTYPKEMFSVPKKGYNTKNRSVNTHV